MDVQQRGRLFELGRAVTGEAILDALFSAHPDALDTNEVLKGMDLPTSWRGSRGPERRLTEGVLHWLAEEEKIEMMEPGWQGNRYRWRYIQRGER